MYSYFIDLVRGTQLEIKNKPTRSIDLDFHIWGFFGYVTHHRGSFRENPFSPKSTQVNN